jgi:hypothetical protein
MVDGVEPVVSPLEMKIVIFSFKAKLLVAGQAALASVEWLVVKSGFKALPDIFIKISLEQHKKIKDSDSK